MRSFTIDTGMFSQPGFELLFDGWASVFETDDNNNPVLSAEDSIKLLSQTRREVLMIYPNEAEVGLLEQIACRYAQVMPVFLEERLDV